MKNDYDKLLIEYLIRNKLDLSGEKVIIGVSCGLDSSVLLDILEKKSKEFGFEIIVCHVNHKRRAQSEIEEEYIRSYCEGKHKFYCLHLEYNDVIDKENDVGNVTSSANSAIVHSGYDPVPGTLKAKLNVKGSEMMQKICEELE